MADIDPDVIQYLSELDEDRSPTLMEVQARMVAHGHDSELFVQFLSEESYDARTPDTATLLVVGKELSQKVMAFARSLDPSMTKGLDDGTALIWGATTAKEEVN
jgi:hypothetical protein